MIQIKNLTKKYGNKTGNFNINLKIEKGEVFGLLGPNGAGKTTLIRQIMGFIKSDSGEININGLNPWNNSLELMNYIGFVPGENVLYDNLTGRQYIEMYQSLRKDVDREYKNILISHFDIDINVKIKKMSKGMKQKISLISAILSKPQILILDEPTSGFDPVMKNQFNILIEKLKSNGTTILICSHIIEEVSKLCDRIGFLNEGKLIKDIDNKRSDTNFLEKEFAKIYSKENFL